ncbi:hypothetical protein L6164_003256 [Bauhinia variegata]|uniref:Uncharacterized protein n=1 Tax=Bauhinia variegata TaxID=167791 RepID=A0ACB9Q1B9_BAUVA|nr:hypothetical protein L6164_003256 [Bauhinia variegata]
MEKRSCSDSEAGSSLPSKKVYSIAEFLKIIAEIPMRKRGPPLDFDAIDSCSKRQRVEAGFVHANCSANEGILGYHRNVTKVSDLVCGASKSVEFEKESTEKKQGKPIDSCKKLQCCVILRRMMINPDGKDFHDFVHSKASSSLVREIEPEKPMDMMGLESKLDKAEKVKEREDSNKRADHCQKLVTKPSEPSDSETSRKRENAIEKVKEREDLDKRGDRPRSNSKPSANVRKCTMVADVAGSKNHLPEQIHDKKKKTKRVDCQKSNLKPSANFRICPMVANAAGSKNHLPEQIHEEKKKTKRGDCSDVTKCTFTAEPTEHFLDTIMKSQQSLLDFGCKRDLLRMQQREAARAALEKMEREVFIDDSLKAMEELELL